jgi:O-antigen/teichoic acid export membrane protein
MRPLREWVYGALRWSERYTKTDMVYATKGGFWLAVERFAALVAGFGMAVAFANLLPLEKYGVYKYVLSMVGIIGAFALAGMNTAVNRAVARGFEGALKEGFLVSLRWSVVSVFISFGIAGYYFFQGNNVLGISFLIAGSFSPFIGSASLYDNFLSGAQRFSAKAIYGSLRNIIPPIGLVITLLISKDPLVLIATYFVSTFAVTYFCYRDVVRRYRPHTKTDHTTLNFSKHLSVMNILDTVGAQADRVITFSYLGGTALAIYSFAEMIPDQIRGLSNIVGTLAFPKLSRTPLSDLKKTLPRKALLILVVALIFVAVYFVCAPAFFNIFFPKYAASVPYSQLYALSVLSLPSVLFSRSLLGHMKKRELYILKTVPTLCKLLLMFALLPAYGLWGIVAATLLSYMIGGTLLLFLFFRAKTEDPAAEPARK